MKNFFVPLVLGPLAPHRTTAGNLFGIILVILLTVISQFGGIAVWIGYGVGNVFRDRKPFFFRVSGFVTFLIVYSGLSFALLPKIAPLFGTTALNCFSHSNFAYKANSGLYCLLNRQYVTPDTKRMLEDLAGHINRKYPGSVVTYLDAGFPITGFPLLPHLSHKDGRKLDIAFFYQDRNTGRGFPEGGSWPVGYWAFTPSYLAPYRSPCKKDGLWRWNADAIQFLFADTVIDEDRTKEMTRYLARNDTSNPVEKLFLEPHLKQSFGLSSDKIRFAGCNAARHDDHIHIEVK